MALFAVAGCALIQDAPDKDDETAGEAIAITPAQPEDEAAKLFPRPPERPIVSPEQLPPEAGGAAVPFPTVEDVSDLIGKSEAEVYVLLGPASRKREETTATVLEYGFGECRLDLFLYMDVENKVFRTLAYEVTGDKPGVPVEACEKALRDVQND